jgi:phosphate acetyltransferase
VRSTSWHDIRVQASQKPARIILADGDDPRVVEAAARAVDDRVADPVLIGKRSRIEPLWKKYSSIPEFPYIDPDEFPCPKRDRFSDKLQNLPKYKSLSKSEALERLKDPLILGCLYLHCGLADGFVGGATRTTAETLRAVFSIVGLAHETTTLFGFFLIEKRLETGTNPFILLADCAVIPDPTPKQLANIAIGAASAFEYFTKDTARVAVLSFSTKGSADHPMVQKVQEAVALARQKAPDLTLEGEWQADTALDLASAQMKGVGGSLMAGRANVLVAPDLNSGNIAYKLVQRVGGCRSVGPILWGTALPANDLSRGCSSEDVLDMLALTSLQARKTMTLEKPTYAR